MKYEKKSWSKCWCVLCCILNDFWGLLSRERFWHHFLTVVLVPAFFISFFFSAFCALTKKIETKKLHHLIAHTYTEMPPLDFQDLVLLSFIAWNHCVIVLFIFDLVYILNQILRSMLISSTHSNINYDSKLLALDLLHWFKMFFGHLGKKNGFPPKPASKETNVPKSKSS